MGHEVDIYPHNDLLNLAHYHKGVIEEKMARGEMQAIGLDCMSCLIALAFSAEAIANFVGHKTVQNWDERAAYKNKLKTLAHALNIITTNEQEPFATLKAVKDIRDQLAHGKPIHSKSEVSDRATLGRAMACPWDEFLNPEFTQHAFAQVKEFERILLEAADIDIMETLTSGSAVCVEQ